MSNISETKARYVKPVIINSLNDVDKIEKRVNGVVEDVRQKGGKIVSLLPISFGLSPMTLIYNIIYESENPIK